MIDLKKFKESLGAQADKMTEAEILKLREQQDKEAEIFFKMWLDSIKNKKKHN